MSTISSSIELQDNFTGILYQVIDSVNLGLSAMDDLRSSMASQMDTASFDGTRDSINQAAAAVGELEEAMQRIHSQDSAVVDIPVEPVVPDPLITTPEPVEVPVVWRSDNLEVFTDTGTQRFEQEIRSANSMLAALNASQQNIINSASAMDILPQGAAADIAGVQTRLEAISRRMQAIENNPLNVGTDAANTGLERLRGQFDQIEQAQQSLNRAMEQMDVSGANDAYLRLSRAVSGTEMYIRDNINAQGQFNQTIEQGSQQSENLLGTIKKFAAAYLTVQGISSVLDVSDELSQSVARLNAMNDGAQSTQELMASVYASAQDARGAFFEMADVVARFGNNAKDAFSSSAEVVAFSNLIQKQMTIAGASTAEASAAMLQLSQALGSGVLRGDELNSIFEQAPNLIQNIADYLDVPIGEIRELASEGELTADIVKSAIFDAADEINANFEAMPMTFEQAVQSIENMALMAFQPALDKLNELTSSEAFQVLMVEASRAFSIISGLAVEVLDRVNDIANNDGFQSFIGSAVSAFSVLAGIALGALDLIIGAASIIADNWNIISPVILGVAAALAVYNATMGIAWLTTLKDIAAKVAHAVASAAETAAIFAMTVAQEGLNVALAACPITWIIIAIIALIAVIFAVCAAIAKFTGAAESGFGVFCGAVNVAIAFSKNLFYTVANVALGIWNALSACANNIQTAFRNAFYTIESGFYELLSTALKVVEGICKALNKLPFIEFDYSGIAGMADSYAHKSAEAFNNRGRYESVTDAFSKGFNTFDTFQDGWISDAFKRGAAWGDSVGDKISGIFDNFAVDMPDPGYDLDSVMDSIDTRNMGNTLDDICGSSGDTAANTAHMADSLSMSAEELRYLREIAEREAINKFTTAEIKITMNNNNAISGNDDIDGFINELEIRTEEAMTRLAEGDHI